jgi:hypothetical protein
MGDSTLLHAPDVLRALWLGCLARLDAPDQAMLEGACFALPAVAAACAEAGMLMQMDAPALNTALEWLTELATSRTLSGVSLKPSTPYFPICALCCCMRPQKKHV